MVAERSRRRLRRITIHRGVCGRTSLLPGYPLPVLRLAFEVMAKPAIFVHDAGEHLLNESGRVVALTAKAFDALVATGWHHACSMTLWNNPISAATPMPTNAGNYPGLLDSTPHVNLRSGLFVPRT